MLVSLRPPASVEQAFAVCSANSCSPGDRVPTLFRPPDYSIDGRAFCIKWAFARLEAAGNLLAGGSVGVDCSLQHSLFDLWFIGVAWL